MTHVKAGSRNTVYCSCVGHGRSYVVSYVEFIHYGERIYQAAEHPPSHHAEGAAPAAPATHGH